MQSAQTSSSPADQIAAIIRQDQEPAIMELFETQADQMYGNPETIFFLNHEVTPGIRTLLERLSFQYVADKVRLKQWDKLVTFYHSAARYHVNEPDYSTAKIEFEKTLFYLNKYQTEHGNTGSLPDELSIQKEYVQCCEAEIRLIAEEKPSKSEKWRILYSRINHLLPLISELTKMADKSKSDDVLTTLAGYRTEAADNYISLGLYFVELSNKELKDDKAAKTAGLLKLADSSYALALNYFKQAILLIGLVPENSLTLTSYQSIFDHTQSKRDQIDPKYRITKAVELTNHLALLAENQNTPLSEFQAILSDPEFDINQRVTFWDMIPKGSEYESGTVTVTNWAVSSGNLTNTRTIVEYPNHKVWLFPTDKRKGVIEDFNDMTLPDVFEYITTPNNHFYQNDSQKPLIDFFLDALAGRLDKVKEYLDNNPDAIIEHPEIVDETGIDSSTFETVLNMANRTGQRHVMWFLDEYAMSYVTKNWHIDNIRQIRGVYESMMSCYQIYGFTEKQLEATNKIRISMITLLEETLLELEKKPEDQRTAEEAKTISEHNYRILLIKITDAKKSHDDGIACTDGNHMTFFIEANAKYAEIVEKIFKLDALDLPATYAHVCQTLMTNQENIQIFLEEEYLKLEKESLTGEAKSDDEDEDEKMEVEESETEEKKHGEKRRRAADMLDVPDTNIETADERSNTGLFPHFNKEELERLLSPQDLTYLTGTDFSTGLAFPSLPGLSGLPLFHRPAPIPMPSQPTQSTNPDPNATTTATPTESRPKMG